MNVTTMNYWYIWYEIYEDGKLIPNSRGRYTQGYSHKASAERRAKQMWSADLYNPMTETIISRKWIVSKTNPWKDVYIFETRADAERIITAMLLIAERYGHATRADIMELLGDRTVNFLDNQYGWTEEMLRSANLTVRRSGTSTFSVAFPKAMPI